MAVPRFWRSTLTLLLAATLLTACAGEAQPETTPMRAEATPAPTPIQQPPAASAPAALPTATGAPIPRQPEVTIWAPYAGFLEQKTLVDNAGLIDEVNFVWHQLTTDGEIGGGVQSPEAMAAARAAGLRIVPSIQNAGFSRDSVAAIIHDPARRAWHVQELASLVEENGYDGLDLDYENLAAEDRADFTLLVEELAAALHRNGKLLSIAVHPKVDDNATWDGPTAQDWARLGKAVDEFKIMSYDYHWSTSAAGPLAPLAWVDQVLSYAATVVPPEKTYLGIPFYGYDWIGATGQGVDWQQATRLAGQNDAAVQRDPSSGEAWFAYDDDRHRVYFNDAATLRRRLQSAFERHPALAGIAIWSLGSEDPENWAAIAEAFR